MTNHIEYQNYLFARSFGFADIATGGGCTALFLKGAGIGAMITDISGCHYSAFPLNPEFMVGLYELDADGHMESMHYVLREGLNLGEAIDFVRGAVAGESLAMFARELS